MLTTPGGEEIEMKCFIWAVWRRCRLVGYVNAYSEWEAQRKAQNQFGSEIFIVRHGTLEKCDLAAATENKCP